ncbi:hypothetical protein GQ457_05G017280 [Hibiscus cannabinus]
MVRKSDPTDPCSSLKATTSSICSEKEKTIRIMRVEKELFVKFLLVVMVVSVVSIKLSVATLHRVGNSHGWSPNVNYSEWSDHDRFYVGDWLRMLSPSFSFFFFNLLILIILYTLYDSSKINIIIFTGIALFNFDKRYFNVLEVNQTSYENCNDQGFIKNITRGGRDVIELTEARPYYFLSSGGYCYNGMKVAVDVAAAQAAPAPAPVKNGSPPSNAIRILDFLVSFAVVYFLLGGPFV